MKFDALLFFTFRSLSRGAFQISVAEQVQFVWPVIGDQAIDPKLLTV